MESITLEVPPSLESPDGSPSRRRHNRVILYEILNVGDIGRLIPCVCVQDVQISSITISLFPPLGNWRGFFLLSRSVPLGHRPSQAAYWRVPMGHTIHSRQEAVACVIRNDNEGKRLND